MTPKKKPIIFWAFGDTHENSYVGLCPEGGVPLDLGGTYYPSQEQSWLMDVFKEQCDLARELKKKHDAWLYVLDLGDGCDDNSHSKYGLITANKDVIIQMGVRTRQEPRAIADEYFRLRGTEAHTGGAGWMEESIAREIGATPSGKGTSSWTHVLIEEHGVRVDAQHHPANRSYKPWTKGGGANREAASIQAVYGKTKLTPKVAFRGHVHHLEDSGHTHMVRVFFTPPNQLCTSYGSRLGYFGVEAVGGIFYIVYPDGTHSCLHVFTRVPKKTKRSFNLWTSNRS